MLDYMLADEPAACMSDLFNSVRADMLQPARYGQRMRRIGHRVA
ncbi:hypothetical protein [Burkholderia seminalis]|nr:hypothetical protein [Burkholderia seminalis]VWC26105.1 hypothetical protein BSE24067_06126 [Burkholderia seminalis]